MLVTCRYDDIIIPLAVYNVEDHFLFKQDVCDIIDPALA